MTFISSTLIFKLLVYLFLAVCKFKAHKRCAVRSTNNCKWTTLASIGNDIIEDDDGVRKCALLIQPCLCFKITYVLLFLTSIVPSFPVKKLGRSNKKSMYVCLWLCVLSGVHAAPVAGRKLTRQCQMYGVRQELWQCAAAAGLALPLVQSHCK